MGQVKQAKGKLVHLLDGFRVPRAFFDKSKEFHRRHARDLADTLGTYYDTGRIDKRYLYNVLTRLPGNPRKKHVVSLLRKLDEPRASKTYETGRADLQNLLTNSYDHNPSKIAPHYFNELGKLRAVAENESTRRGRLGKRLGSIPLLKSRQLDDLSYDAVMEGKPDLLDQVYRAQGQVALSRLAGAGGLASLGAYGYGKYREAH
jgi:hypothetical protein